MITIISDVPEATKVELEGYNYEQHDTVFVCDDSVRSLLPSLQSIRFMCEVLEEGNLLTLEKFPHLEEGSITIEFSGVPKEVRSEIHPYLAGLAKRKIDYKTPDLVLRVVRAEKDYLCLQLHDKDLSKRDYRIFAHKQGLRGDFAFMIVQKSDPCLEGLQIYGVKDGALLFEQVHRYKEDYGTQHVYEPELNTIRSLDRHLRLANIRDKIIVHGGDWKNLIEKLQPAQRNLVFLTRNDEKSLNTIFNYFSLAKKGSIINIFCRSQCYLHPHPLFKVTNNEQLLRGQHAYNFYTFVKS